MKALLVLSCALALLGCSQVETIAPTPVVAASASFDGNQQSSGLLSVDPRGALVTAHFLARFRAMAATYGRRFDVPPSTDAAAEGSAFRISLQQLEQFLAMNRWRKAESPKP